MSSPQEDTSRKGFWAIFSKLLLLGLLLVMLAGSWLTFYYQKPGPALEAKTVVIPKGTSVRGIARTLAEHDVITNPGAFEIVTRIVARDKVLKAGEYIFPEQVMPKDALSILTEGETVVRRLTIPEGFSVAQVRVLLGVAKGLKGPIPDTIAEGSLLPDTYHYHLEDERIELVQRMQDAMQSFLDEAWNTRQPDLPVASKEEALILASIVEKETGVASERPQVAAVFVNRLKLGMPLQSDPTVIYGIKKGMPLGRALLRKDLEKHSPYNTYSIKGLPPEPIANPGRKSIQAVLNPADTKALYFVADGKGGHRFANSLDAHNNNVNAYRRELKRQKAAEKKASMP